MSFFYIFKYLKKYLIYIITFILVLALIIVYLVFNNKKEEIIEEDVITKEEVIEKETEEEKVDTKKYIKVDIKGAVNNPGVYELEENTRVSDAINVSGGLRSDADTSLINLSKLLKDEMVVIIYTKDEIKSMQKGNTTIKYIEKECICPAVNNDACIDENTITNNSSNDTKSSTSNNSSNTTSEIKFPISINTASADELTNIPGIGEKKAQAIVEYRNTNGNFNSIEEITNVSGIGNSTFEKIKEYITI